MVEVRYESGQIVAGDGKVRIYDDGRIVGGAGSYEAVGLYESLREFFRDQLPEKLVVDWLDGKDFEIHGDNGFRVVKEGGLCKINLFGYSLVEYESGLLKVGNGITKLVERISLTVSEFVNGLFWGRIALDVNALERNGNLVLETDGIEIAEIKKKEFVPKVYFCLIVGTIHNQDEIIKWLRTIARAMKYEGKEGETLVFSYGAMEVTVWKNGVLNEYLWKRGGLSVWGDRHEFVVRYYGDDRVMLLETRFDRPIHKLFREENSFLRKLLF